MGGEGKVRGGREKVGEREGRGCGTGIPYAQLAEFTALLQKWLAAFT